MDVGGSTPNTALSKYLLDSQGHSRKENQMPDDPSIPELPVFLRWDPRFGPQTDPIDMDIVIRELDDPLLRQEVIVTRLEGVSAVHRARADAAAGIAAIVARQKR
jgi:hypothetical protein